MASSELISPLSWRMAEEAMAPSSPPDFRTTPGRLPIGSRLRELAAIAAGHRLRARGEACGLGADCDSSPPLARSPARGSSGLPIGSSVTLAAPGTLAIAKGSAGYRPNLHGDGRGCQKGWTASRSPNFHSLTQHALVEGPTLESAVVLI